MKKILLIGFPLLDYLDQIKSEIENLGCEVTCYSSQAWTTRFKLLKRLSKSIYDRARAEEQRRIVFCERFNAYDAVVVVQPHRFSIDHLKTLRSDHPESVFISYNWDSIATFDYTEFIAIFDRVLTFDRADAERLGLEYLPLFAVRRYQSHDNRSGRPGAVYFAGRIDSINRYLVVRAFKEYCSVSGLDFRCHMMASVSMMWRLMRSGYIPLGTSTNPLPEAVMRAWISESNAVFDYPNHNQTGYTMRVIENMCAGKKIVTSNELVLNEDFYTEEQFMVFRTLEFSGVSEFVKQDDSDRLPRHERFYVQNFVRVLLGDAAPANDADTAQLASSRADAQHPY